MRRRRRMIMIVHACGGGAAHIPKVVPRPSRSGLVSFSFPSIICTIFADRCSPSPEPSPRARKPRVACANLPKMNAWSSAATPGPVSLTSTRRLSPTRVMLTDTRGPSAPAIASACAPPPFPPSSPSPPPPPLRPPPRAPSPCMVNFTALPTRFISTCSHSRRSLAMTSRGGHCSSSSRPASRSRPCMPRHECASCRRSISSRSCS